MERRSWPWKRKSSQKMEKASGDGEVASPLPAANQDNYKKPKYVQISLEQYSHLTGMEEQVRTYEEQVKAFEEQVQTYEEQINTYENQAQTYEEQVQTYQEQVQKLKEQNEELSEKLSTAHAEITTKDSLVKQHNKVAEDAVSGWEKAEAEALALKSQLESVTFSKLTAEDKAAYLDGALKECMRQIRNLKEEHEQKLQDVFLTKTRQMDKMKTEFEAKLSDFEQELFKSAAENDALSRSLQERSNMLVKMSEEKSRAEAEIERLRANIESREREISSLKYEIHVASKELEIRNEERNMSVKSAEAANKQHMEGVKKIAKLEAECQRLRGLVRKRLPGPAALAQMKLEVESLGRDCGDGRLKRSPVKPSSPHKSPKAQSSPASDFLPENAQKFQKENEFLTERLLAMEEETKMLKEALAKRNGELQASRSLCAKTASKAQALESQVQQKVSQIPAEVYSSRNASNPPSLTSMSEDGNDDSRSCAESLVSDLSHTKGDKNMAAPSRTETVNHLELMDDFLEMEKLACSSNDSKANGSVEVNPENQKLDRINSDSPVQVTPEPRQYDNEMVSPASLDGGLSVECLKSGADELPFNKLQLRILKVLKSVTKEADLNKIIEDVKCILQEMHDGLTQHTLSDGACNEQAYPEEDRPSKEDDIGLSENKRFEGETEEVKREVKTGDKLDSEAVQARGEGVKTDNKFAREAEQVVSEELKTDDEIRRESEQGLSEELKTAVSQIHEFVSLLEKEAGKVHEMSLENKGFREKVAEFSITSNKMLSNEKDLADFVFDLSHVLVEASELKPTVLGAKCTEVEIYSPDCIDKVALPESNMSKNELSQEKYENGNSSTHIEVPDDGKVVSGSESSARGYGITLGQFEALTQEKDRAARDLAECLENLEGTKSQLQQTEVLLAEIRSQLASAQKSNSLAETQLKCMAESYRLLETRTAELEMEAGLLKGKIQGLEKELESEKTSHHEALARCQELEEQLRRKENELVSNAADANIRIKQERELASATEMLAECQQTIFILGKQIQALRPQADGNGSPRGQRSQISDSYAADGFTSKIVKDAEETLQTSFNTANPAEIERLGVESSQHGAGSPKDGHASSGLSSSSSGPTPEKPSRGFSRFFSSKA